MEKISFIIPSRDNLKYLKWAYEGLRKNCSQEHQICMADDASTDGTWEWMVEEKKKNKNLSIYRNFGPDRLGLTILYDYLVEELATNDVVMFFHADMYPSKDMDKKILDRLERGTVVSATRIEPPLHPDGPEKIISPLGFEPEEFDEKKFNQDVELYTKSEYTEGVFAPWALYKEDYLDINGHDQLFIPQSREDSDIFNRFYLNGYQFRQILSALIVVAVAPDLVDAEIGMRAVGQPDRGRGPADFFHGDDVFEIPHPGAAEHAAGAGRSLPRRQVVRVRCRVPFGVHRDLDPRSQQP